MITNVKIAFDNSGGIVLITPIYAHAYQGGGQVAADVRNLLDGGNPETWDGNDEALLTAITPDELDRYERVYRLEEIAKLLSGEDENTCVGIDRDERSVEIHWGCGGSSDSGSGYAEFEFWAALLPDGKS